MQNKAPLNQEAKILELLTKISTSYPVDIGIRRHSRYFVTIFIYATDHTLSNCQQDRILNQVISELKLTLTATSYFPLCWTKHTNEAHPRNGQPMLEADSVVFTRESEEKLKTSIADSSLSP